MSNIHEIIEEQTSLAKTYADDGAFQSAARVLRELAGKVQAHSDWCYAEEHRAIAAHEENMSRADDAADAFDGH